MGVTLVVVFFTACYFFIALVAGVMLCYARPPSDWVHEFLIGMLAITWPVLLFCFVLGRLSKILALSYVDKVIVQMSPEPE